MRTVDMDKHFENLVQSEVGSSSCAFPLLIINIIYSHSYSKINDVMFKYLKIHDVIL